MTNTPPPQPSVFAVWRWKWWVWCAVAVLMLLFLYIGSALPVLIILDNNRTIPQQFHRPLDRFYWPIRYCWTRYPAMHHALAEYEIPALERVFGRNQNW